MAFTTLPKRKAGLQRKPRPGKVLSGANTADVAPIQDPGLRAPAGAFGADVGAAVQQVGQDLQGEADRLQSIKDKEDQRLIAAQLRIAAKQDNNRSMIMVDEFEKEEQAVYDDLVEENVLGDVDFNDKYSVAVGKKFDEILGRAKFSSEEAKLEFQGKMLESRFKVGDTRGIANSTKLNKRQTEIARQSLRKYQLSPDRTGQGFNEVISGARNQLREQFGDLLSETTEDTLMNEVVVNQFEPQFSALIAGGDLHRAHMLLENADVQSTLSAQQWRANKQRLELVENKITETLIANTVTDNQTALALGKPVAQLTPSERADGRAGRDATFEGRQDVETAKITYKTDSPTTEQIQSVSRTQSGVPDPDQKTRDALNAKTIEDLNYLRGEGRTNAQRNLQAVNLGVASIREKNSQGERAFEPGALADLRSGVSKTFRLLGFSQEHIDSLPFKLGKASMSDLLGRSLSKLALSRASELSRVTNMSLTMVREVFGERSSSVEGLAVIFEIAGKVAQNNLDLADLAEDTALRISSGEPSKEVFKEYRAEKRKLEAEAEITPEMLAVMIKDAEAEFGGTTPKAKTGAAPKAEISPEDKSLIGQPFAQGSKILGIRGDRVLVEKADGTRGTVPRTAVDEFIRRQGGETAPKGKPQGSPSAPRPAEATSPQAVEGPEEDLREDGTPKGEGFLGRLERPDGQVSTELAMTVEVDGKELLIPALVPGLDEKEIKTLLDLPTGSAKQFPESVMKKAIDHAQARIKDGKSPFLEKSELAKPVLHQGRRDVSQTPDIKPRKPQEGKFDNAKAVEALDEEAFERFISTTPASRRTKAVNEVISKRIKSGNLRTRHAFTKKKEGFISKARDIGDGTLTIGHGITSAAYKDLTGKTLKKDQAITENESAELVSRFVDKQIDPELEDISKKFKLNANQKEALTSLIFNVGLGAWKKSKARKAILKGDTKTFLIEAFDPKIGFLTKNKKFLKGLQKRRKDERTLFLRKGK